MSYSNAVTPTRRRTTIAAEGGFTVIEVLVTMVILSVGLLAVMGPLESANQTAYTAQRSDQLVSWGQREMERLRTLSYGQLGHDQLPTHEDAGTAAGDNNPVNPNFYVVDSTSSFLVKADYRDSTSGAGAGTTAAGEPLIAGGTVTSGDTFAVAGLTGRVYRYVTWRSEQCVATAVNCNDTRPTGQNSKRITLAIAPDAAGNGSGAAKPIWLTTVVTDPNAIPAGKPSPTANPGSGPPVTAQPFFLDDRSCNGGLSGGSSGGTADAPPHATHNTSEEGKTCADDEAPDTMRNVAPEETSAAIGDYSSDLTRQSPAGGLILKRPPREGFVANPLGAECPTSYTQATADVGKWTIHTWATEPLSQTGGFKTPAQDGRGALSFYTQTVNGVSGGASMCLTLRSSASPNAVLASTVYEQSAWPTEPTELSFAFDVPETTIPQNERLLLTLSVKGAAPGGGLAPDIGVFYGHPAFGSLLTIATTTPLN